MLSPQLQRAGLGNAVSCTLVESWKLHGSRGCSFLLSRQRENGAAVAQADEHRVKRSLEGARHEPAFCSAVLLIHA